MVDVTKGTKAPLMPLMGERFNCRDWFGSGGQKQRPKKKFGSLELPAGIFEDLFRGGDFSPSCQTIPSVLASVSKNSSGFLTSAELPSALSLISSPEDGPVKA